MTDLFDDAPRFYALRALVDDIARTGVVVGFFNEQPIVLAVRFPAIAHAHESPTAVEFFAEQLKLELALPATGDRVALRRPVTAVPDDHRPGAILACGNLPFESTVI